VLTPRLFILSPARLDGERARMVFEPRSNFPIAAALRTREGAPIGEVYKFLSGLYFRGKLAYAKRFARPPEQSWMGSGALVITTNRGLVPVETRVCLEHLEAFAETDIKETERSFRGPFVRDAKLVKDVLDEQGGEVILLGSIASKKYVEPLLEVFGEDLLFPSEFVGRGDMSRGGLLLRCVDEGRELGYVAVKGANRKGARPPKLPPRKRSPGA